MPTKPSKSSKTFFECRVVLAILVGMAHATGADVLDM